MALAYYCAWVAYGGGLGAAFSAVLAMFGYQSSLLLVLPPLGALLGLLEGIELRRETQQGKQEAKRKGRESGPNCLE